MNHIVLKHLNHLDIPIPISSDIFDAHLYIQ